MPKNYSQKCGWVLFFGTKYIEQAKHTFRFAEHTTITIIVIVARSL